MSLHEQAAAVLDGSGALELTMRIRRVMPMSTVVIVTFHRIAEPEPGAPLDPDVVDATPAQFRRHVETLARFGTPIGIETLVAALDGAALPRNPIMITFDDGYRSCRDVVLPILVELGVPATFFIATGFTGTRRLYWWEQIAAVLARAPRRIAWLAYPRRVRLHADDPRARRVLADIVKNTRGLDVERFLAELRAVLDVDWSPAIEGALAASLIMDWDDIRALADAGMDVESHTRRHRVLETLDPDDLRDELVGSRRDLETALGRPVRALAYPVGRPPPERVRRAVAEAGYRLGFTNAGGVNRVWPGPMRWMVPLDPFDIRRMSTERSHSDALFRTILAVPALAF